MKGKRIYYLLLSGEHKTLPLAEIRAILESEKVKYNIIERVGQLLRISCSFTPNKLTMLKLRAAMLHEVGLELFYGNAKLDEILSYANQIDWSFLKNKSFCVRVKKVGKTSFKIKSMELEKRVGSIILNKVRAKVNLKNPDIIIRLIIANDRFSAGILLFKIKRGVFKSRRPRNRPFFHPCSMDPVMARVLINLARCKPGTIVLDPFVGAGGIALEAASIGCYVVGIDIDNRMTKGSLINLRHFNYGEIYDCIHGDSTIKLLRDRSIDSIVTDPPYGMISSTHGKRSDYIVSSLIEIAAEVLKKDGFLVFVHPQNLCLDDIIKEYGFIKMESHKVKVHASLTRIIEVCKLA